LSHFKERAEKICLNCNAELIGRFCHQCGQENIEPRETVWGLITHFFYDITHFDGKFFTSLKWLVLKPGFLSKEYVMGRRARHLNPIRMYVFTSAFFFIMFFSFFVELDELKVGGSRRTKDGWEKVEIEPDSTKNKMLAKADTKKDSADIEEAYKYLGPKISDTADKAKKDKKQQERNGINILLASGEFPSVAYYDSVQKTLPEQQRDGWFVAAIKRREIRLDERFREQGSSVVFRELLDKFLHSFPQLLFVSLPLVALILQLLYIRRRNQFYYVNHGIFLIHIYIYSFINLLLFFAFEKIDDALDSSWMAIPKTLLVLHAIWYVYKAMRNFYGQGRFKTFVKFMLLNIFTLVIVNLLFAVFFILSAWNL
jgi:hypothetical protein